MKVTVRPRLLLLVLSVVVPWLLGLAWWVGSTFLAERQAQQGPLRETARALSMAVDVLPAPLPSDLQRALDSQPYPTGWTGAVLDDSGTVVARHPAGGIDVESTAANGLRARMKAAAEGLFESVTPEGEAVTGYYITSSRGWTSVSTMPGRQFSALIQQAVIKVAVASTLLLGLALAGVIWVAQAEAAAQARHAAQRAASSQRAETLARLTGGVAHDFNNLLGIISNSAHLIERHPAASDLQVPLAAMRNAVETGAQQLRHLLQFAARQPAPPQPLELSRFLPELHDLLRSVTGKRIAITVRVAPSTAPVHVDPGELELALVQLAMNASDAMPAGGELRVVAHNTSQVDAEGVRLDTDSRFVNIAVSDDGVGMEPELAARVFDPCFTTRPGAQGPGLGLSQVQRFCRQAGGGARLDSTLGLGTTVSLLLPAARQ